MSELTKALVAAQGSMPDLQRDKINPHFKSAYLSLEKLLAEVIPVLNKAGLAVAQFPTFVVTDAGALPALRTVLIHGESGDRMEDTMLLQASKNDPQGQGSAITYAKRYALMALCGLSADEDDDGNKASQPPRRRAASSGGRVITEAQQRKLFETVREASISADRAREIVKERAGVDDSSAIPADRFDAVIDALKAAA